MIKLVMIVESFGNNVLEAWYTHDTKMPILYICVCVWVYWFISCFCIALVLFAFWSWASTEIRFTIYLKSEYAD